MTQNKKVRPAMTAIAAVIALSSPSFAQSAGEPIAVTSGPAIEVAPAPVTVVPPTLTPVPVVDIQARADPLAPEAAAKPAARKSATARSASAPPSPMAAPAASAEPMIAAPRGTISDPDAAAPVAPLALEPLAEPVQAPVAEPSATSDTDMNGSNIPIAGIGALGIMALVGTGLVLRRRRRRAEDADDAARRELAGTDPDTDPAMVVGSEPEMIDELRPEPELATPATAAEAATVTAAVAAAVVAAHEPSPEIDGPVTELPEDFDVSQFGLHAQAAYNGPTEDNPSLSLKNRLSRANGLDQLAEREAEAEVAADSVDELAAKPAEPRTAIGGLVLGRAQKKPGHKPIVVPAS
jgi:hypothetical protein